jgi:hypothetical protein
MGKYYDQFEVLTAVIIKSAVFRVVAPCGSEKPGLSEEYTAFVFMVGEQAKQEISRSRRQTESHSIHLLLLDSCLA